MALPRTIFLHLLTYPKVRMHIASLEDDAIQGQLIRDTLQKNGYQCTLYTAGRDLINDLPRCKPYDLILLDWEVPDISGLDVLHWIRSNRGYTVPVMFITSRTTEADLVTGLRAGADDYMVKPIRPAELVARTNALLRRSNVAYVTGQHPFRCAIYDIDPTAGTISVNGKPVDLAPKEYDLALLFFRNPGRLFSRDVLSNSVWNREIPATSRTLDTHLSNIRRKLQLTPENGVRLHASYALGYRLELITNTH